ncbi:MAG: glucosaminidase domain-containing protein, partial [Candidatus Dormibacteria bacterium]
MDGVRQWGQTGLAALVATAGALTLVGATGGAAVSAAPSAASVEVATLGALVAKTQAQETNLRAQVQTARQVISRDLARIHSERGQLADLVAQEYTGAPDGLLSVLASPSFNSALDTQITLDQLTHAQRQLLLNLAQDLSSEERAAAQLKQEQQQEAVAESRLEAEELVAEYQAAHPPPPPPPPSSSADGPAVAGPTPTPTPPPSPPPPPPPPPNPPQPGGGGGPFTVDTNLTLPSDIGLAQIQNFLQGTPLEVDSGLFLQAEQTEHVSAIYLVSDAVLETGWGTSCLYSTKHNLFGFGAYDGNPCGFGESFASDQDCVAYVSWFVSVYYLTPPGSEVPSYGGQPGTVATGRYYNLPTPAGMNVDYASDQS